MTGIEKAIQKSGSASALGFALGVTKMAVSFLAQKWSSILTCNQNL